LGIKYPVIAISKYQDFFKNYCCVEDYANFSIPRFLIHQNKNGRNCWFTGEGIDRYIFDPFYFKKAVKDFKVKSMALKIRMVTLKPNDKLLQ
jgi:hypothetical protein